MSERISPDVARGMAVRAIDARHDCREALNATLAIVAPFIPCEERRSPECSTLTFHGYDSLPYCTACGWTLSGNREWDEPGQPALLDPRELGTLLAAIALGIERMRVDDASTLAWLESATEKIKRLHGLPTGPAE